MKNQIRKALNRKAVRSHRDNLCFIHIPKTGGTSFFKAYPEFKKYNSPNKIAGFPNKGYASFGHYHPATLYLNGKIHYKYWYTAKFFTIVRNPYHRTLSVFNHFRQNGNVFWNEYGDLFLNFLHAVEYRLERGEIALGEYQLKWASFAAPQWMWLEGKENVQAFQLERIPELSEWLGVYGFYPRPFSVENKGIYTPYQFNQEHFELINQIYERDFDQFSYQKILVHA